MIDKNKQDYIYAYTQAPQTEQGLKETWMGNSKCYLKKMGDRRVNPTFIIVEC